ncbi:hypothetical protein U1Q18_022698, partial [Sarracenia purpurea var. burkii]
SSITINGDVGKEIENDAIVVDADRLGSEADEPDSKSPREILNRKEECYLDLKGSPEITIVQTLAKLNKLFSSIFGYVPTVKLCKQGTDFP